MLREHLLCCFRLAGYLASTALAQTILEVSHDVSVMITVGMIGLLLLFWGPPIHKRFTPAQVRVLPPGNQRWLQGLKEVGLPMVHVGAADRAPATLAGGGQKMGMGVQAVLGA